eukprot:6192403-Pleurochrysis_carterae.AAC.4
MRPFASPAFGARSSSCASATTAAVTSASFATTCSSPAVSSCPSSLWIPAARASLPALIVRSATSMATTALLSAPTMSPSVPAFPPLRFYLLFMRPQPAVLPALVSIRHASLHLLPRASCPSRSRSAAAGGDKAAAVLARAVPDVAGAKLGGWSNELPVAHVRAHAIFCSRHRRASAEAPAHAAKLAVRRALRVRCLERPQLEAPPCAPAGCSPCPTSMRAHGSRQGLYPQCRRRSSLARGVTFASAERRPFEVCSAQPSP